MDLAYTLSPLAAVPMWAVAQLVSDLITAAVIGLPTPPRPAWLPENRWSIAQSFAQMVATTAYQGDPDPDGYTRAQKLNAIVDALYVMVEGEADKLARLLKALCDDHAAALIEGAK